MLTFNISHGSKAVYEWLLTGFAIAVLSVSASAIPMLQLDIAGGTYNTSDETTYATGNKFTLQALYTGGAPVDSIFYISAAIVPKTQGDFGSFRIGTTDYDFKNPAVQFGTPPADDLFPDLAAHGIYPTYYAEIPFTFTGIAPAYNVETGEFVPGDVFVAQFSVDISGLNEGLAVHFDLYDEYIKTKQGKYEIDFAPFSHDAQSLVVDKITDPTPPLVPDASTTLTLLGAALMGLGALHRRWKK